MQHNNQDFDDIFRDRFMRAETPPPAEVWAQIALKLAQKKQRRVLGFSLAGTTMLVGLALGAWFYFGKNINQNSRQKSTISTESAGLKNESAENISTKNESVLTDNLEPQVSQKSSNLLAEKSATRLGLVKNAPNNQQLAAQFFQKNNTTVATDFSENKKNEADFMPPNSAQLIDNQRIADAENQTTRSSESTKNIFSEQLIDRRASFFVKSTQGNRAYPPFKMARIKKRKPTCPSFADHGKAFLLEVFAGPSVAFKTLALRDSDTPNYLKSRLETEGKRASWTAGARAGWLLDRRFLVRVGLNYTQINERFDYYDPNSVIRQITQVVGSSEIDTIYVYGERFLKSPNRFGMLDLPITIGYEMGRGHFGIDFYGGASVNLLFLKSGKMVDLAGKPTNLKPNFRSNAGFSVLAGAQIFYQTNKTSRIFIEPHYQRQLRSVTKSNNPISQKYGVASVAVGFSRLLK